MTGGGGTGGGGSSGGPGGGGVWAGGGPPNPPPGWYGPQNVGGGDNAARAAAMTGIASNRAISPLAFPTGGGCSSLGGGCVINPATGNLLLHASPPAGDASTIPPILSYNSTNAATSSEIGNGWTHTFKRQVQIVGGQTPVVVTGNGQSYTYHAADPSSGGYQSPTSDTPNTLEAQLGWGGFTETQPDGTFFQYGSAAGTGIGQLQYIQNAAGARGSMTYDSSSRVSSVTDPFGRPVTLSYNPTSGKISSVQDWAGRITSLTVNGSGNLASITSPELCVTSILYDGSNRPIAWINPLGDTTSYSFDANNRVTQVQLPLGQLTTLSYPGSQTSSPTPGAISRRSSTRARGPSARPSTARGTGPATPGIPATASSP